MRGRWRRSVSWKDGDGVKARERASEEASVVCCGRFVLTKGRSQRARGEMIGTAALNPEIHLRACNVLNLSFISP